jgi:Gram-negative porin
MGVPTFESWAQAKRRKPRPRGLCGRCTPDLPETLRRHKGVLGFCLPMLLAAWSPASAAKDPPETGFDYDVPVADAPIESEVFGPRLTFTNPSGGVTVFYGQFNLAYQSFDDGQQTTSNLVDNGNWNSRLGVTFTQPIGENILRARFESGLTMRNSSLVSQTETRDWGEWRRTLLRWFEVALDSDYGTFSLGQGATAANGSTGLDDSFTFVAGATDSTDGFASFRFRNDAGELTPVSVGQVNSALDALRRFRFRYDTPVFGGVMLSTSYGQNVLVPEDKNGYYDVAIRWTGDLGEFAVRSALGYQWIDNPDGAGTQRLAGSVSILHQPTGLNFALSAGDQVDGPNYYWARAGWRINRLAVGTTSLSIDYYNGSDFLSKGAKTENYGVYAVQDFNALSLNVYAGWRRFSYSDQLGNSYRDANGLLVGARWFF